MSGNRARLQEELMMRTRFTALAPLLLVLAFVFGLAGPMSAEDAKNPYPSMAPFEHT
jgi:hypothetical protein